MSSTAERSDPISPASAEDFRTISREKLWMTQQGIHFWQNTIFFKRGPGTDRNRKKHGWDRGHVLCVGLCGFCGDHFAGSGTRPLSGPPRPQRHQQGWVFAGWAADDCRASCHVTHGQLHVRHHCHRHAGRGVPVWSRLLALWLLIRHHVCHHRWDFRATLLQTCNHQCLWGMKKINKSKTVNYYRGPKSVWQVQLYNLRSIKLCKGNSPGEKHG